MGARECMTMHSLMRHISNPHCHDDVVDELDIVVSSEITGLVRAAASGDAWDPVARNARNARNAGNALRDRGMFVDVMRGRADATHTLTTSRAVYVLRLV